MVGIVVVSHSRPLAEAAVDLAMEMAQGSPPRVEVAAGLDDHVLGTDAARVKDAIERAASGDGVLVLMDLGSAVLSAELAVELRGSTPDCPVVLSDAPLVEGLVVAVALASMGAPLAEVAAEAAQAATTKAATTKAATTKAATTKAAAGSRASGVEAPASTELTIRNEHGLHARPAARFVETARRFEADVKVRNVTLGGAGVSGRSVSALSTLGALPGHRIEVTATGRQSGEVLAAITALVSRNFDEPAASAPGAPGQPPPARRPGSPTPASPGIGIGPKTSLVSLASLASGGTRFVEGPAGSPQAEHDRLVAAIDAARAELTSTRAFVAAAAGDDEARIFDAHLLLLEDEELVGRSLGLVSGHPARQRAEKAWDTAVSELSTRFAAMADPYLRARAEDVRAVGNQVLGHLLGRPPGRSTALAGVVVATDITPAQAACLDPAKVAGVVMAAGSALSHGAILARSLGIPAVVAAGEAVLGVADGTTVLVDGSEGTVVVDPAPSVVEAYREKAARLRARAAELVELAARPAVTTDGQRVEVCANIASRDDAHQATQNGADGVGVLRTEFLFLDRPEPPSEEEQVSVYLDIAQALGGLRLSIRTLDVGGDKPVPYLPTAEEANPFLGARGLRLSLSHADMFKQQLRAVLRTAARYPVTVLFPMVTTVEELRLARALLVEAALEVGCAPGTFPPRFEVGAMAEVPAFALRAHAAVPLLDVFSIGSNDLTQYTLAAERGNAGVAALADPLDPAVLRLVAEVARAAGRRARVAVCGEMASDPSAAAVLVGLGVRELSMAPRAVPEVKQAVRALSARRARRLAQLALQCGSAASVRALLSELSELSDLPAASS